MDRGGDGRRRKKARRDGETFVAVASGPSLARWQSEYIRDKARAISTNTSFRAIEKGQIAYGCDGVWWDRYHEEAEDWQRWTGDKEAAQKYGLNLVTVKGGKGLCLAPWAVNSGGNSGYQVLNLAYHMGASRIVMIGYDMQYTGGEVHWHGHHPEGFINDAQFRKWIPRFDALAADLEAEGVEVINCTVETALTCFPRADLRDVL